MAEQKPDTPSLPHRPHAPVIQPPAHNQVDRDQDLPTLGSSRRLCEPGGAVRGRQMHSTLQAERHHSRTRWLLRHGTQRDSRAGAPPRPREPLDCFQGRRSMASPVPVRLHCERPGEGSGPSEPQAQNHRRQSPRSNIPRRGKTACSRTSGAGSPCQS
ncbi:hypothetical protein CAOG_09250 [Capsaspora owczarzaki ATCC 30864]|uniref:hypothetical protein n=1 Tax=Capsaspora owczarzaki (strain ATCC 30864) TaxID=595528 RepID=UPI0003520729|nr:hypothetical protein CAOG_09250 [Capsaspora owczarzaki ATCC 30864]|eukprot:XP_011270973.1 hypothetical protein CAOG_09250 [Capsaspora owczarzaki ATCC 30864]